MNENRLNKWIDSYIDYINNNKDYYDNGLNERIERKRYYQSFDYNKIINMSKDELLKYISNLWSVLQISVYKIVDKNGVENFKKYLADLLYGNGPIKDRFNSFNDNIVEFKVKSMSEVLSYNFPNEYMLWNSKVESVFNLIGIDDIDQSSFSNCYEWYKHILKYGNIIKEKLVNKLGKEIDLLDADYFYEYVATKEMNYKKLDRIVNSYYTNLEGYIPNELYKWEAVQCFQNNWNINAKDIKNMLDKSYKESSNLLTGYNYFPIGMIKGFAEKEPETTRKMFINLYDESKDLNSRIEAFVNSSEELLLKYWDSSKHHYQDLHAISTYLTFMYPEKYYIYKASIAKKASSFLEFDINVKDKEITKIEKDCKVYNNYLKFCDRIMDHIKDKDDLFNKAESISDIISTDYNMFAQDILYYMVTKYMETKYWILSPKPGNNINCWDEFLEKSIIRIGWEELGDLTEYNDKQAYTNKLQELYGNNSSKTNDAKALYDFTYEMKVGDYVLIKNGKYNLYGYGKVTSDYIFDGQNIRQVEWIKTGDFDMTGIAPEGGFATKTLTDITQYEDGEWAKRMIEKMEEKENSVMEKNDINNNINYYWLNVNPKYWSFSECNIGEMQEYTSYSENGYKRRVFTNYESIKQGDVIVVYESYPKQEIVGLAELASKSRDNDIFFKKIEHFDKPIKYDDFANNPKLKEMEYLINPQGSLFKLTKEEYSCIHALIRQNNPRVEQTKKIYGRDQFDEKVFLPMDIYDDIVNILNRKRNVILQGPPGVGKTYMAKKLAFSMMGEIDESRIKVVQFHQSYSYEDFIEGYRPEGNGFELKKGIFYEFCKMAENDHEKRPYFFIIDEINRGNLSKIFGELLVLIEKDKRANTKVNLVYSGESFTIPDNLYIIGMMNTADRSLAIIDYALRRRFSFVEIRPAFDFPKWKKYQEDINNEVFDRVINVIKEINSEISRDTNLTSDCMIGHSYFSDLKSITPEELQSIIKYEILPLLKEYYIDNIGVYERFKDKLEGIFK